jgi:hypothetical protein
MVNNSPLKVDQLAHALRDHSELVVAVPQPAKQELKHNNPTKADTTYH